MAREDCPCGRPNCNENDHLFWPRETTAHAEWVLDKTDGHMTGGLCWCPVGHDHDREGDDND